MNWRAIIMDKHEKYIEKQCTVERFVFELMTSNMYIVLSEESRKQGAALVVDPNVSDLAERYLESLGVQTILILLTHEHYDHTLGLPWLQRQFPCKLWCHQDCAQKIALPRHNRPTTITSLLARNQEKVRAIYKENMLFTGIADLAFLDTYEFDWFGSTVKMVATPGHTSGSCCIELDGHVFTGDSMLADIPIITRFPTGSQQQYDQNTLPYLLNIPDDTIILPGHGSPFIRSQARYENGCFHTYENVCPSVMDTGK